MAVFAEVAAADEGLNYFFNVIFYRIEMSYHEL